MAMCRSQAWRLRANGRTDWQPHKSNHRQGRPHGCKLKRARNDAADAHVAATALLLVRDALQQAAVASCSQKKSRPISYSCTALGRGFPDLRSLGETSTSANAMDIPTYLCVFLKLLGPSPGPQCVGVPTRDTDVDTEIYLTGAAQVAPR